MTMNFNRKTCMRLAAGTVLCGGAAFGGLLWWQLQAFDQMTDSRLERGMGSVSYTHLPLPTKA